MAYKEMGYLPEALVNYLVRLGWSYGDQEIFARDELIDKFSLEHVGKAAGVYNIEKLLWLNAHYIKEKQPEELVPLVEPFLAAHGYPSRPSSYLAKAIATLQSRCQTLVDMAEAMGIYMVDTVSYEPQAAKKFLTPEMKAPFAELLTALEQLDGFDEKKLEEVFQGVVEKLGLKLGKVAQPVRVALTGKTVSPGLFEVIDVLGKGTVLGRLREAMEFIVRDSP
jgi:glutamyl-tRNA synthetase